MTENRRAPGLVHPEHNSPSLRTSNYSHQDNKGVPLTIDRETAAALEKRLCMPGIVDLAVREGKLRIIDAPAGV